VYALVNQKGGVGKTTTAVNLGAYLAARHQRVLLIDIDPQANATSSLGIDKQQVKRSTYHILIDETPLAQTIHLTKRLRLDLAPSSVALAGAEVELVELPDRERRLKRALSETQANYDYVLIDCPPSLGLLTVNALTAAQGVLVPVQCEYLALEGLSQLMNTIQLVRRALNPGLIVRGLIMTMYDSRMKLAQQVVSEARSHFGNRVFGTLIPRSVRLSEAPSFGEPILSYAPTSSGGVAYDRLADELLTADRALDAQLTARTTTPSPQPSPV
ncbi:MAG TPA: AAA family ATPase, partial [Anaerolineae bacterium]|nr:AAA family ATPase [Anaerolineae bacterium]